VKDLAVIVPSRHRPGNIARLCTAFTEPTRALLVICQDDDDEPYDLPPGVSAEVRRGPRKGLVGWTNAVSPELSEMHRFLGSLGDDHMPRTPGWDDIVCEALDAYGVGMVYGDDLIMGPALPTAVFMRSSIVAALGYMAPPGIEHQYCDNAWLAWGREAHCARYLSRLVIEHHHPLAGKAVADEVYAEAMTPERWAADERAWLDYSTSPRFREDVTKIRTVLV
jgi:hypothetical protein